MLKKLFAVLAILFSFTTVFAQVAVDPQDDFYIYAQSWELKGYVKSLPQLRPYPLNVIKDILNNVIEKGSLKDVEVAKDYFEQITGKPYYIVLEGGIRQEINYNQNYPINASEETLKDKGESKTRQYNGGPRIVGDVAINPRASFAYNFGIYTVNEDDEDVTALFQRSEHDTVSDASEIGPFRLNIDMNSNLAVGTEKLYVQAGINRSGYGPFLKDDLALSDNAFHSPNITFAYDGGFWNYAQIIQSIGSSRNNGTDLSKESKVNKYLSFHAIRVNLTPKFKLSFYESTVIGQRFDLAYILPAPFMAIQGIGDSTDNSQMGLLFEYSPILGFKWSTCFLVDDISMNNVLKLKFDTKIRVGIESGIQYAPIGSLVDLMTLNYTLITPYTYAHWSYENDGKSFTDTTFNYFNYMNRGIAIGASIPPNSDKIGFSARFSPSKRFSFTIHTNFARHANIYESLDDEEAAKVYKTNYYSRKYGCLAVKASDGTPITSAEYDAISTASEKSEYIFLNTDGGDIYCSDSSAFTQQKFVGDDVHVDTAWDHLNWLNQNHAMTIIQAGFDMSYELPKMKPGTFTFNFGWIWEYIENNGVQNPIYSGKYGEDADAHKTAYDAWVNQLHESFNNYLTFSVKLKY